MRVILSLLPIRQRGLQLFACIVALLLADPHSTLAQRQIAPEPEPVRTALWDVAFADSMRGIAVGDYGVIRRTTDGGRTWDAQKSKTQMAFRNVRFIGPSTAIAVGFWGTCYRSSDAGATWEGISLPVRVHLPGLAFAGGTLWVSGDSGVVCRSSDSGKSWKLLPTGTRKMLDAIAFSDAKNGWCSSVQGMLLRTTDGGDSWKSVKPPSKIPITSIVSPSPRICIIAGYNGLIASTVDAGKTWSIRKSFLTHYSRIVIDAVGRGWAAGKSGAVVAADFTGANWTLQHTLKASDVHGIAFPRKGVVVAVGSDGVIERFSVK